MANTVLVVAVNKACVESAPIKVYQTVEAKLPKQFVLKLTDAGVNDNGHAQTRVGNFALNLIVTNGTDYLDEKLKGFRRKHGDDVFIVCKQFSENVASIKDLGSAEEF